MSNTYIAPAKDGWKLPEILEEMKDGVYLLGSRGGQVSTAEGVFQFNAKRGYLVEEGEIRSLLRDVSSRVTSWRSWRRSRLSETI